MAAGRAARAARAREAPPPPDGEARRLGDAQRPVLADVSLEVLPLHELHGDEVPAGGLAALVDLHHVGMGEGGDGAGLALEAFDEFGVRRVLLAQDLQGDDLPVARPAGAVDHGHAALADGGLDLVAVGQSAGVDHRTAPPRLTAGSIPTSLFFP